MLYLSIFNYFLISKIIFKLIYSLKIGIILTKNEFILSKNEIFYVNNSQKIIKLILEIEKIKWQQQKKGVIILWRRRSQDLWEG